MTKTPNDTEGRLTGSDLAAIAWVRKATTSGQAREIREKALITLEEVARGCGVDASAVSMWERGERSPGTQNAIKYAHMLRILPQDTKTRPAADHEVDGYMGTL